MSSLLAATLLAATAWAASPNAGGPDSAPLQGVVLDGSGAAVPGATLRLEAGAAVLAEEHSGPDGRFRLALDTPAAGARVRVSAAGFATAVVELGNAPHGGEIRVVLLPAPLSEEVAVTATRGESRLQSPESVSVLGSAELSLGPAGALDDALRSTPGFSLFRRSSSRVANPTTQGVTLRGVSGSGASRALVLADGLPLNDAFGSWVYWSRVPIASVERVEVVRGPSDLYGTLALGGVLQVLTLDSDRKQVRGLAEWGAHDTGRISLFGSANLGGFSASLAGEWLDTDGVPIIAESERGPVDVPAYGDERAGVITLAHRSPSCRTFLRGAVHAEDRGNGTPLQQNTTDWRQLSAEAACPGTGLSLRAAVGDQTYTQTFSAVAADRKSERLTAGQRTPSSFVTAAAQWLRPLGRHVLLIGAEGHRTDSTNEETRYTVAGAALPVAISGGTEGALAFFARDQFEPVPRLTLSLGARGELWDSEPRAAGQPSHDVSFFAPRLSAALRMGSRATARLALARAFRTPTLNELHRGFRAGNVETLPNVTLEPERLESIELGLLLSWTHVSVRGTGFLNRLEDAVANVTLSSTPALIVRERRNVSAVRSAGFELEADVRPRRRLQLSAQLALTNARYRDVSALPELQGKRVPQVPLFAMGLSVSHVDPRAFTLRGQLRVSGEQYDDDLNQFVLGGFGVFDASIARALKGGAQVFVAVENLFDVEYDVGRTPVRSVGWPRTLRAGIVLQRP